MAVAVWVVLVGPVATVVRVGWRRPRDFPTASEVSGEPVVMVGPVEAPVMVAMAQTRPPARG